MKNTAWQKIKPYLFSAIVLALCVVLSCGSVFAWLYYSRTVNGAQNIQGADFGASLNLWVRRGSDETGWEWVEVSPSFNNTKGVQLDLGRMDNFNQLPDSKVYFKAKVKLTTPTATNWYLSVDNIEIEVWYTNDEKTIVKNENPYSSSEEGVGDYFKRYNYLGGKSCTTNNVDITNENISEVLTLSYENQFSIKDTLEGKQRDIAEGSAENGDHYVYFYITPTDLSGLQQLVKDINVSLMPYYLNLAITITAKSVLGTPQEAQV